MKVNLEKETEDTLQLQKSRLQYSPETGQLTWLNGKNKGKLQGSLSKGYIRVSLKSREYYQHRLQWAIYYVCWPTGIVDHIDRNKQNNRIDNLRQVTEQQNRVNTGTRSTNTTGVIGVSYVSQSNKYRQDICVDYKLINLGFFNSIVEAAQARLAAEEKYFK